MNYMSNNCFNTTAKYKLDDAFSASTGANYSQIVHRPLSF